MIYLAKQSGFDIKVDNDNHEILTSESVAYKDVLEGSLEYVRGSLLNSDLDVPIHLYRVYQDLHISNDKVIKEDGDYKYDLLLMPPNVVGVEYVKTHGHIQAQIPNKDLTYPCIIEVLYGAATFLLQRFSPDFDKELRLGSEVDKVFITKVQKGSRIVIPPNYAYTMINTRSTYLITGKLSYRTGFLAKRSKVEEKHGFAYYVIRKNARQEIVMNPRYKNTPQLLKLRADATTKLIGMRSAKPLIEQLKRDPSRFKWLKDPSKLDWVLKEM